VGEEKKKIADRLSSGFQSAKFIAFQKIRKFTILAFMKNASDCKSKKQLRKSTSTVHWAVAAERAGGGGLVSC
jgi:hypothetical protein